MTVRLVEGPFRILNGEWRFTPLAEHACRVDFRLHYEFSSVILDMLVSRSSAISPTRWWTRSRKRAEKAFGG